MTLKEFQDLVASLPFLEHKKSWITAAKIKNSEYVITYFEGKIFYWLGTYQPKPVTFETIIEEMPEIYHQSLYHLDKFRQTE